jgi:hypothetical protein
MVLLQRFFRREDKFISLLQASADEGCASAKYLARLLDAPLAGSGLRAFQETRDKELQIGQAIDALLCESYTTPFDREDVEQLARALYRIPKTIKKFAERYLLSADQIRDVSFAQHVRMLEAATHTVSEMVSQLRRGPSVALAKASNDILQKIEGDADKMMVAELQQLYQWQDDILTAVILKDLYELLERAFDRCRNAGNIIFRIVLKNS